ncbi:hypothetical protein BGZ93_009850 [Podila epicladia]|nr:hypothetical protein BGZ93_009850 [Podila epicladia]
MLSHDNLAKHTLHHQELDHKRDFVQEYLESLDSSVAPELDAERFATAQRTMSAPVSSFKTKGSGGGNSKTAPRHHHHHHQHNTHSHDKDKKGKQLDPNMPSSLMVGHNNLTAHAGASTHIGSAVPKQPSKEQVESQLDKDNPTMIDHMKRKDISKAKLEDTKHKKKRKKQMDDVELDVEKLDINARYDVHHALQQEPYQPERTDNRTTAPEKSRATVSSRKRASKSRRLHDDLHDKQPPDPPQNDERQGSRHRHRLSLDDRHNTRKSDRITDLNMHSDIDNTNNYINIINNNKNNNNINIDINNNSKSHDSNNRSKHNNKRTHHLAGKIIYSNIDDQDGKEFEKNDNKKPRMILTQDSLVLNQFSSSNTTKGRITLPNAPSRLGLFQKGKASQKIAIQDHGYGFSETNFLRQTVATPMSENHDRPDEVVTSSYFEKPKELEPKDHVPSPKIESRSGFSANENATDTSALSKHSIKRRKAQKYVRDDSSCFSKSRASSTHRSNTPPNSMPISPNSGFSPSTHSASISPPLSPGRNSPEHTVDAILQELIPDNRCENQPSEGGQARGGLGHMFQEACPERQNYTGEGDMLLGQPFEAASSGYIDTGQYFDMYGYPLEPQPNTRESIVQHFTAVSVSNPDARNMYYEWHLEPVYRWPTGGAGYLGSGYPYHSTQGRAASHPGSSAYIQQEEPIRLGYYWQDHGTQQENLTPSNQQAHFEWRPHRFY